MQRDLQYAFITVLLISCNLDMAGHNECLVTSDCDEPYVCIKNHCRQHLSPSSDSTPKSVDSHADSESLGGDSLKEDDRADSAHTDTDIERDTGFIETTDQMSAQETDTHNDSSSGTSTNMPIDTEDDSDSASFLDTEFNTEDTDTRWNSTTLLDSDSGSDSNPNPSSLLPRVLGLTGDGSLAEIVDETNILPSISAPILAPNRFQTAWIVTGERLDTVERVHLWSEEGPSFRSDAPVQNERIFFAEDIGSGLGRLMLPGALSPGRYTLELENEFGSAAVTVHVLRGETGEKGSPGAPGDPGIKGETGDKGIGLLCDAGSCALPNGNTHLSVGEMAAIKLSTSDSLLIKKGNGVPSCPRGYIHNNEVSDYTLCEKSMGNELVDEMVKVGEFWIDKYESSIWQYPDCSGIQYGATGSPWSDNVSGGVTFSKDDFYSCSLKKQVPSRNTSWFIASQSCYASNKYLCNNDEWQMAALGTFDLLISTPLPGEAICNNWNGVLPKGAEWADPELTLTILTGTAIECISNAGANDMIGNLSEWISDWWIGGRDSEIDDIDLFSHWPDAAFAEDGTWGVNGRAGAVGVFWNGLPVAVSRGHSWLDTNTGGVYSMSTYWGPSTQHDRYGVRCCRRW